MSPKNHRGTARVAHVSLRLRGIDWSNLVGIQPVISEGGFVQKSHLFFTCRTLPNGKNRNGIYGHSQVVAVRKRIADENSVFNKDNYDTLSFGNVIFRELLKHASRHEIWLGRYERYSKEWYYRVCRQMFIRMRYMQANLLGAYMPNFIIGSDPVVKKLFFDTVVNRYVVSESFLPKDCFIIGCSPQCVYANPLVACPIIPKEGLMDFCNEHSFDTDTIKFDPKKRFPMIDMQLDWYEIYKLYLEHVGVDKWHLEVFNDFDNISNYYTLVRLT